MSQFKKSVGSKAEVYHGAAAHTSGGLKKKDLMKHKGRIISRKKHAAGKKAIKHLFALGYKPKKGTFKLMRKTTAKGGDRKSRKNRKRGGALGVAGFADAADAAGAKVATGTPAMPPKPSST